VNPTFEMAANDEDLLLLIIAELTPSQRRALVTAFEHEGDGDQFEGVNEHTVTALRAASGSSRPTTTGVEC
jgi:hypothetical protein